MEEMIVHVIEQRGNIGALARAQALAITANQTILKVGAVPEVRKWAHERYPSHNGAARVVEHAGLVLPGLTDTHEHPVFFRIYELADPVHLTHVTTMAAKMTLMEPAGVR